MAPTIHFGTATFGMDMSSFQDTESVEEALALLKRLKIEHIDTAPRYPPLNPGRSEQLLGGAREPNDIGGFVVDTKVFTAGDGALSQAQMDDSVSKSLERLKLKKVNVLLAHSPDPATPLEEQAAAFQSQIEKGRCERYGLSNYPPDLLKEFLAVCEKKGHPKPSVYQGHYNLVTRGMEKHLLPTLRRHGIAYTAFAPLAAGLLTGNVIHGNTKGTRLDSENPLGNIMRTRYGGDDLHGAMREFDVAVKAHELSSREVALRWLYHHSVLEDGDGILLGASKLSQIADNVECMSRGPLPEDVVSAVEQLWTSVEPSRSDIWN